MCCLPLIWLLNVLHVTISWQHLHHCCICCCRCQLGGLVWSGSSAQGGPLSSLGTWRLPGVGLVSQATMFAERGRVWSCCKWIELGEMVLCCRCNRTSSCRGCACVKARRQCSNCLPSKLGSCSNISSTPTPSTATPTMNQSATHTMPSLTLASNSSYALSRSVISA